MLFHRHAFGQHSRYCLTKAQVGLQTFWEFQVLLHVWYKTGIKRGRRGPRNRGPRARNVTDIEGQNEQYIRDSQEEKAPSGNLEGGSELVALTGPLISYDIIRWLSNNLVGIFYIMALRLTALFQQVSRKMQHTVPGFPTVITDCTSSCLRRTFQIAAYYYQIPVIQVLGIPSILWTLSPGEVSELRTAWTLELVLCRVVICFWLLESGMVQFCPSLLETGEPWSIITSWRCCSCTESRSSVSLCDAPSFVWYIYIFLKNANIYF